jgi:hypothetical protein
VKNNAAVNMESNTEAEGLRKHKTHNPPTGIAVKNNAAVNMESNTEAEGLRKRTTHNPQSGAAVKNNAAVNMESNTEAEGLRKHKTHNPPSGAAVKNNAAVNMESNTEAEGLRKRTTHNPGAAVKNNAAAKSESNTEELVNMEHNVHEHANFIETQRKSLSEWGGWSFWRRDTACMNNAAANMESNTDALVSIEHNVHETANFVDSEIESLAEWLRKRTTLKELKKVMQIEAVKARLQVRLIH